MSVKQEKVASLILEALKGKRRMRKYELMNDIRTRVIEIYGLSGRRIDLETKVDRIVSASLQNLRHFKKVTLYKGKNQGPGGSWALAEG